MPDMENFVADIVSAEKVPYTQGSLASKPVATWVRSSSVNAGTPHYYF